MGVFRPNPRIGAGDGWLRRASAGGSTWVGVGSTSSAAQQGSPAGVGAVCPRARQGAAGQAEGAAGMAAVRSGVY